MTAPIPHTARELHSRVNDGIHVRMLWHGIEMSAPVALPTQAPDRLAA